MNELEKLEVELGQNLKDQSRLKVEMDEIEVKIKGLEVTYSIGDRFVCNDSKSIIGCINGSKAVMITLSTGMFHSPPVLVGNVRKITECELKEMCSCPKTYYWDRQRKIYTGPKN